MLDEAQAVKNPQTQRVKAARGLRAEFRVALSGMPLENHLGELWSLFPGLLGSWDQFRDRFASPIALSEQERAQYEDARLGDRRAREHEGEGSVSRARLTRQDDQ